MTSITQERAALAAVDLIDLTERDEWGAQRSYTDPRTVDEPADHQFIHIAVINPESYSSEAAMMRALEAIGIARFSNTGVSYNRAFTQSGGAFELQPVGRRGAHTVNDFRRYTCTLNGCPSEGRSLTGPAWNLNYNARAYVFAANVQHSFTDAALDAMARSLAADRLAGFVRMDATLHGHRCVSAKLCPGDRVWARMGELEQRMRQYMSGGEEDDMPNKQEFFEWMEEYETSAEGRRAHLQSLILAVRGSDGLSRELRDELQRVVNWAVAHHQLPRSAVEGETLDLGVSRLRRASMLNVETLNTIVHVLTAGGVQLDTATQAKVDDLLAQHREILVELEGTDGQ